MPEHRRSDQAQQLAEHGQAGVVPGTLPNGSMPAAVMVGVWPSEPASVSNSGCVQV